MTQESGYPAHWEADVLLRDGRPAHLRPIRADDADGLVEFHKSLSPETIYYRFFAPYPELSERDVDRFTQVDYADRVGLVITQSGEIIGIGRYDRISDHEAEIAFTVRDDYQGRGIGSVLLEHLAAVARENGISMFYAEVLPDNRRMINTFAEAGYRPSQRMADGVVKMEFDIEPTADNETVMRARERASEARSVASLMYPSKIAVIGASRRPGSIGQVVLRNLREGGFTGSVYAVHPEAEEIEGVKAYPSVASTPGPIDLAIVTAGIDSVPGIVEDCAVAGVRAIEVIATGFSALDPEGTVRKQELVATAREAGMRVIGPEAMGIVNTDPRVSLNASLAEVIPGRGRIGFFCESGTLGATVLEDMAGRRLGLTTFVSAGLRADLSGNDLLQYWESDDSTAVVLLYLQSLGNPRKFTRIMRRLSRRKPVIAVLAGRTGREWPPEQEFQETELPPRVVDELLRQSGVLQTTTLAGMLDAAAMVALQPELRGPRVALVSNSAALLLLSADLLYAADMTVVEHPYRVAWNADPAEVREMLEQALAAGDVDAVLFIHVPPVRREGEAVDAVLHEVAARATKPLVAVLPHLTGLTGRSSLVTSPGVHGLPGPGSVPIFGEPAAAISALAIAGRHAAWLAQPAGGDAEPEGLQRDTAALFIGERVGDPVPEIEDREHDDSRTTELPKLGTRAGRTRLSRQECRELLATYGLVLWPSIPVGSEDEAVTAAEELGYPVVLKTEAHRLMHRTDLGGIRLNLENERSLRTAYLSIAAQHPADVRELLVVQRMAPAGVPCSVLTREDPAFGPVLGFAVGGVLTDLVDDWAWRMPPLSEADAAALVRTPRTSELLFGFRGSEPADIDSLIDSVRRLGALADDFPQITALVVNPLLATPEGAYVLGADIHLSTVAERPEARPRRL